ncbi:CBL-interacting serine/threonine-protein kinase 1 isoform X1 [Tanacetum coccineum]
MVFNKKIELGLGIIEEEESMIRLGGKYEIGRTLGEGNFGKVKYAKNIHNEHSFALKIIHKNHLNISEDQIKREMSTLTLLNHPNVIRLHEVLISKTKFYMVLEYVTGGELFYTISVKWEALEPKARKLFQELIDGVSNCHDKGVFHRNLKLDNVLVDSKGHHRYHDFGALSHWHTQQLNWPDIKFQPIQAFLSDGFTKARKFCNHFSTLFNMHHVQRVSPQAVHKLKPFPLLAFDRDVRAIFYTIFPFLLHFVL